MVPPACCLPRRTRRSVNHGALRHGTRHLPAQRHQAVRLGRGRRRRHDRRPARPLLRLARPQRLRQDDPDPDDARARPGQLRRDRRARPADPLPHPRGAVAGGRDRRGAALLPLPDRPQEPRGLGGPPGARGPRRDPGSARAGPARRPRRRQGRRLLARHAPAARRRPRAAQRPRAAGPRRADQRPRPGRTGRVPRDDPRVRRRGPQRLHLVPHPRRGREDGRRRRDHREGQDARLGLGRAPAERRDPGRRRPHRRSDPGPPAAGGVAVRDRGPLGR